jgi:hypothetical protein
VRHRPEGKAHEVLDGGETVIALFLPETTDLLFLRLRPSHGQPFHNPLRDANFGAATNNRGSCYRSAIRSVLSQWR